MILRKPYAFFIKMFKPIHLILSALLIYSIYLENKILEIFNNYINTDILNIENSYTVNNGIYIIPIIVIVASIIILTIMYQKNKPYKFYFITIISLIFVIVVNSYSINVVKLMTENILPFRTVKMVHDLMFINIVIDIVLIVLFIIRGLGINIKRFDFSSDLSKMDISDKDKEEYEVSLNINYDETKKKRKRFFRNFKYFYFEHKFICNITILFILIIITSITFITINNKIYKVKESTVQELNGLTFKVNKSMFVDTNTKGKKFLSDSVLVVVDINLKSNYSSKVFSKDFNLDIEGKKFYPTDSYSNELFDLGKTFTDENIKNTYTKYLLVFEIPLKYKDSKIKFNYVSLGKKVMVNLNPTLINNNSKKFNYNISDKLEFKDSLSSVSLKINNYEIVDKYKIDYKYCYQKDCIDSSEYIKPSYDKNYDKTMLKINYEFSSDSSINIDDLINKTSYIEYYINNEIFYDYDLEIIYSNKKKFTDTIFIGVNNKVKEATYISLNFKVRNTIYKYIIKEAKS